MVPVPGLDTIRIAWVQIQGAGYVLYGFLLYTDCDRILVDYMKEGLIELDALSGKECAIFVIESPSGKWIERAKKKEHIWYQIYGQEFEDSISQPKTANETSDKEVDVAKLLLKSVQTSIVQIGNDNYATLEHLLYPRYDLLYDRSEAIEVARHFNVQDNIPCLIFFKDLDDRMVKVINLEQYIDQPSIKSFFRDFFLGTEFQEMILEARVSHARV